MKKPLCIFMVTVLLVALCLGAFSVFAFADTVLPDVVPTSSDFSDALLAFSNPAGSVYFYNASSDMVCGAISGAVYLFSDIANATVYRSTSASSHATWTLSSSVTVNGHEYYYVYQSIANTTFYVPVYSSLSELQSAVDDYFSSVPEPDPFPSLNDGGTNLSGMSSTNYMFSVPAGYMAVIEYQSDLIVRIQQSFASYSAVISLNSSDFPSSTAFYLNSNTLPASGDSFQFPSNSVIQVPFNKTGTLTAVLRQSKTGSATITQGYVSDFFFLCNPSVSLYSDHGTMEVNHDLICSVNHCDSIRLYPISTTVNDSSNVTYLTCSISGFPYYYTVSGLLRDPTSSHNVSVVDVPSSDDDEQSVYSRLLSNITQFFSKGWSSVRSVLDAIGEFPQFFVSLLGGLPSDLTSIIAGFVAILCCIGVIKALI